jgi:hypothetical protein
MASISTMLVGKYIYSQLQVIDQSNYFLEATLNRMKSVARIDYVSPKKGATGIRRFCKSPLRVSSLVF